MPACGLSSRFSDTPDGSGSPARRRTLTLRLWATVTTRDQSGFPTASPWRDRCRRDRRRLDDWCRCLRGVGARGSRRRRLVVGRTRNRRCRRLLQRNLVGAVGGDLSRVRRHLCLRSTAALTLLGACRRVGVRCRQNGVVLRNGTHTRRLSLAGAAASHRCIGGAGDHRRQHRGLATHGGRHEGAPRRVACGDRLCAVGRGHRPLPGRCRDHVGP